MLFTRHKQSDETFFLSLALTVQKLFPISGLLHMVFPSAFKKKKSCPHENAETCYQALSRA